MTHIVLYNGVINGKQLAYSSETEFLIQIGRGKSAYKTRRRVVGNLSEAIRAYNCINIGNKYKKRLLMPSSKKPILARYIDR